MAFAGNLNSMPLEDLLGWLATSQKVGTLVIDGPTSTKKMVIEQGHIVATASTEPEESLSRFLIGWRLVDEEDLERLFAQRNEQGALVGHQLVSAGMISKEQLTRVLTVVAGEVIYDAFAWPAGSFRFLEGELLGHNFHPLRLAMTPITMEGARRVDELGRIRELIPSAHHRPRRGVGFDATNLTMNDLEMISGLDGIRSFSDIADDRRETPFMTLERFLPAVRRRLVEVLAPEPGGSRKGWSSSMHAQMLRATMSLANGRLLDASRIIDQLRSQIDGRPALAQKVAGLTAEVERRVASSKLDPAAVLEVAIPREELFQLQCGPQEGFILSRVTGQSTVAQVMNQVPGDDDAKHLVLLDLLDRGVLATKNISTK